MNYIYNGASTRIGAMLTGRDVTVEPTPSAPIAIDRNARTRAA